MNGHLVTEDAALYALGALDLDARSAIDRHAAGCAQCSRLLGSAENDVACIVAAERRHAPPPALIRTVPLRSPAKRTWLPSWAAVAAVLLLAIAPSAYYWEQNRSMHEAMVAHTEAMSRLAGSGVRNATFSAMAGGASARVMYAPDGSWYVVLVRGASTAFEVAWMHDGRRTVLGTAQPYGDVAMLYLPKSHRMDQLALVDGQRVVAEAQLAY
jgi:hypothetical protein